MLVNVGDTLQPMILPTKTSKKGKINFLPENPEGINDHSLEGVREVLSIEMKKTNPNGSLVKKHMDMTFALRRKKVVYDKTDISQMIFRWPALHETIGPHKKP